MTLRSYHAKLEKLEKQQQVEASKKILQEINWKPIVLYEDEAKTIRLREPVTGKLILSPQEKALRSQADELFYGGSAGSAKTSLLLGAALTKHRRSLLLRREATQLNEMYDQLTEYTNGVGQFNGQTHIWRGNGRKIEFGGCPYLKDREKYKGRAHDLKGFDEIADFLRDQYTYIIAWNRSSFPDQRTRVIATGNPPTTPEGEWIREYWAAWLDQQYPYPAKAGELRWYANIDGEEREFDEPNQFFYKDELITPRSRTFIPGRLADNPYLSNTGYRGVLANLPEPLRSQLLFGDFNVVGEENPWQVIPTSWVLAAQERWKKLDRREVLREFLYLPSQVGSDIARGGCFDDQTEILTKRGWVLFDQVTLEDEVLSLDPETEFSFWDKVQEVHKYEFDGYLNVYDGTKVNFAITDNHNLLVRSHAQSKNYTIKQYDELAQEFYIKGESTWIGTNPETIEFVSDCIMPNGGNRIYTWTFDFDLWAEFVGWYVAEGSTYKDKQGRYRISIAQNEGPKLEMLCDLLDRMGLNYQVKRGKEVEIWNNEIAKHLIEHCKVYASNKRVPVYIKEASEETMYHFLKGFGLGDGTKKPNGTTYYISSSKLLLDDIQEMLAKQGYAGKLSKTQAAGSEFYIGDRKRHTYTLGHKISSKDKTVLKRKVEKQYYKGYVYCVSVPKKTIMVRRKGVVMWSGNSAKTVVASRYGNYCDRLTRKPGIETPDGNTAAALILDHLGEGFSFNGLYALNGVPVVVDALGVGTSVYDTLEANGVRVYGVNFAKATRKTDRSGRLRLVNYRSWAYWNLRELLDPDYGENIALPPDRELLIELTAPSWRVTPQGIQLERKEDVNARTGLTGDSADAVSLLFLPISDDNESEYGRNAFGGSVPNF